ncbi:MAG TPA: hypothetical protein VIP29_00985 [Nitrososphaeraceae archaeon]
MVSNIFKGRSKKVSGFETEVLQRLECLQNSDARVRQDIRQIVREEIKSILNERNKKGWWQIA